MKVIVNISLKQGVLDPQGKAVHHALDSLGFEGVKSVNIGKQIILDLEGSDKEAIRTMATTMCEKLLANTVIEDYEIVIP